MGKESGARVKLDIRADGVYLIVRNPPDEPRVGRKEVLKVIEDSKLVEVDVEAVNEVFKDSGEVVERKITSQTKIAAKDETVHVEVAKNKMTAVIKFTAGSALGKLIDIHGVRHAMDLAGIKHGVEAAVINRLAERHEHGVPYTVATGTEPVNGENGYVKYHFNMDSGDNRPKVLEDGRVDFKQVNFFVPATSGQLLAEIIPPKIGRDGTNVLGQVVGHKPGKPAPRIPAGKGTHLNEEETKMSAACSGRIVVVNKRVNVYPVLEIKGNIGNETGNIDFDGSVTIEGEVMSGFEVRATGDIEIGGMVNGGIVSGGGKVTLLAGIQGSDKAVITSGGDIFTKFAQSCTINCGGNIISDNILHCIVNCSGAIKMEGRRQLIVGGTLRVGKEIRAGVIGSNMATPTDIIICNNPQDMERFAELRQTHEAAVKDYNKFSLAVDNIMKNSDMKSLSQEKKDLLMKSLHTKAFLRDKMNELKAQIDELVASFVGTTGKVHVSQVVHFGVDILIGDARLHVRDDLERCTIKNRDGKIVVDAYTG